MDGRRLFGDRSTLRRCYTHMKRSARFAGVLSLGIALGLTGGWLGSPHAQAPQATPQLVAAPGANTGSFAKLAEAVKPAVINVSSQSRAGGRSALEEHFGEEFYKRFFGNAPERMPRRGLGSGVIIDPSGLALTNAHVVDGASSIEVVTVDGAKHTAKVVGLDKKTDLAVLQLDGGSKPFPFVALGDSDEAQVGDWVIAVGSPFGLQATVTSGIISAKARQIGAGPYDDFIQTDAAINPGNSGGPLLNMRGEVVGINTAIVRGGSGIGFAIPSNLAKRVASELRTSGKVTRGWLGVSLQPLTSDLAASFGVTEGKGALVSEVSADSPAARAGLKSGDVIMQFNGKKIDDPSALARAVGTAKPGETGKLIVWRDRRQETLEVKLGELPAERTAALGSTESGDARGTRSSLGLSVQPLTPDIAKELEVKDATGVVVNRVEPSSPADSAGIQRGDVIVEIDRKAVKTVEDFEKLTSQAGAKQVLMKLQRSGTALFVALAPSTK
jgi:serine protease Do